MKFAVIAALWLVALAHPDVANAQEAHHQHHASQMNTAKPMPTEPGQAAFAAIAEIVAILMSDPNTDWNKVDVDALRMHLVDMNELTLSADVEAREENETIIFEVTGTGRTLEAIRRMVPAHAKVLKTELGWDASAEMAESAVDLKIVAREPEELAMFRGLGFLGIMATGAHHQEHHLAIARGKMNH